MEKSWRTAWALWYLGSHVSYAFVSLYIQDVFKGVDLVMRKEKPKKKVDVDVLNSRQKEMIAKSDAKFLDNVAWIILIVATLISVGIFAISALFTSISLQKDCIITALFLFMIGGYIAIFVFTLSAIIDYEE